MLHMLTNSHALSGKRQSPFNMRIYKTLNVTRCSSFLNQTIFSTQDPRTHTHTHRHTHVAWSRGVRLTDIAKLPRKVWWTWNDSDVFPQHGMIWNYWTFFTATRTASPANNTQHCQVLRNVGSSGGRKALKSCARATTEAGGDIIGLSPIKHWTQLFPCSKCHQCWADKLRW